MVSFSFSLNLSHHCYATAQGNIRNDFGSDQWMDQTWSHHILETNQVEYLDELISPTNSREAMACNTEKSTNYKTAPLMHSATASWF